MYTLCATVHAACTCAQAELWYGMNGMQAHYFGDTFHVRGKLLTTIKDYELFTPNKYITVLLTQIKTQDFCLPKFSAELLPINFGTCIGKDSQILPIRCFADVAEHRLNPMFDPMFDPIIG